MVDTNDSEVQALIYVAVQPEMWAEVVENSINFEKPWEPGTLRALSPLDKCEKCGLPVCTLRETDGRVVVSDIIQMGVMVTREELANPKGRTATRFKIQSMAHICPPVEIAKILRGDDD